MWLLLTPAEKFESLRVQIRNHLGTKGLDQFSVFDMTQYGTPKANPQSEADATSMMRILAQAPKIEAFGPTKNLMAFINPEGLGHFPGFQWLMDSRSELQVEARLLTLSVYPSALHRVLARPCPAGSLAIDCGLCRL